MFETRKEDIKRIKDRIEHRHAEVSRLAGKAIHANAGNEIEYKQLMESLVIKHQELKDKIAELETFKSSREELEKQVEVLWEALRKKYDNAQLIFEEELGENTVLNQFPRRLEDG